MPTGAFPEITIASKPEYREKMNKPVKNPFATFRAQATHMLPTACRLLAHGGFAIPAKHFRSVYAPAFRGMVMPSSTRIFFKSLHTAARTSSV